MKEAKTKNDRKGEDEEVLMGSRVQFGRKDRVEGRYWLFKRSQTPMRVKIANPLGNHAREAVRLPGKILRFWARGSDILKCEAAKLPATSRDLIRRPYETDSEDEMGLIC